MNDLGSRDRHNNPAVLSNYQQQHQQQQNQSSEVLFTSRVGAGVISATRSTSTSTPGVLPFLDEFEFQPAGGLCGRVYGLAGVADGTLITTTPVQNVQVTLPKGFVQTIAEADESDAPCIAYELGKPLVTDGVANNMPYSFDGTAINLARAFTKAAPSNNVPSGQVADSNNNVLVQIVGLTTLVLGSALAVNLLSHHLTVNVFWV
jgi:hypothetical protein